MYCNKCGDIIEKDERFCNKCGNILKIEEPIKSTLISNKNKQIIGAGVGVVLLVFIFLFLSSKSSYYFTNDIYEEKDSIEKKEVNTRGYATVIDHDNNYTGMIIKDSNAAIKLIEDDSVKQKNNCPKEILQIENDIISKYKMTAINLCELDKTFAKEIEDVIKVIYNDYPEARGYLTNMTLANVPMSQGYIAAFMPAFQFATAKSDSTYPWVIKTQILLNSSYFLNIKKLETSVLDGSKSGHFPENTKRSSPVAHELGHYLSYIAMMKYYKLSSTLLINDDNYDEFYDVYSNFGSGDFSKKMIEEAYENYKSRTGINMTIIEFRSDISGYALAKDNSGDYIYDETIAEAFHDYYLNKEKASTSSKEIMTILDKYLK